MLESETLTQERAPPATKPKTTRRAPPSRRAPPRTAKSSSDPTTRYAQAVAAGEIVAGPYVRQACERHLLDLQTGAERGLFFDRAKAQHALDFFPEVLRLNGGQFEGKPFRLLGFQAFIIGSLFGWMAHDPAGGSPVRRFRTAYVEIGKGNGKSPLAAGIGLYMLTSDNEWRAEVYSAATSKDQAMILFADAVAMVDQSPALKQRITKTPAASERTHNLGFAKRASFFRAIASEKKQSGPRPHGFLIDELHEHPDSTVVSMAAAGQKFRRQPLVFEITNSGFDRTTICYQHHEYSRAVLSGERPDDQWFAYVCAMDVAEGEGEGGDDPLDLDAVLADLVEVGTDARGKPIEVPRVWLKANPGLGFIIQPSYLLTQVTQARGMPAEASRVRRLNFCEWVGAENPWIDGALWRTCEREIDGMAELAQAAEVVGALDLSGTRDLTALALTGIVGDEVVARVEQWTPGETAEERSRKDLVPYSLWIEQGYLHATPGRGVDYAFVAQRLVEIQLQLPTFRRIAFDPYRIHYLEVELDRIGADFELIAHPQGYYKAAAKKDPDDPDGKRELPALWMPHSIEMLEREVSNGTLAVERNPVLTHNSASAVLEADPKNNKIFTKRKSRGRIDGLVALAMSVGLLLLDEKPEQDLDEFLNCPIIG